MGSDDLFEAVSHPLRIEIVKALAEKPLRFADLKRALKISSSGLGFLSEETERSDYHK